MAGWVAEWTGDLDEIVGLEGDSESDGSVDEDLKHFQEDIADSEASTQTASLSEIAVPLVPESSDTFVESVSITEDHRIKKYVLQAGTGPTPGADWKVASTSRTL